MLVSAAVAAKLSNTHSSLFLNNCLLACPSSLHSPSSIQSAEDLQQQLAQQAATASQLQVELEELTTTRAQAQQQLAAAEQKVRG